jgi:hypothetical protein
MTEEEQLKAQIEELQNKIAQLTKEKDNVVNEIKEDRQKRQALEEQLSLAQKALTEMVPKPAAPAEDIKTVVKQMLDAQLGEERASVAKGNKTAAIERFVSEHPAFKPENDTTGKLREALETKLSYFNTSNMTTLEQFYTVVRDAASLLGVNTTPTNPSEPVYSPYASTPTSVIPPKPAENGGLSDIEVRLLQQTGMSRERYLQLKAKMPDTIADMLAKVK